MSSASSDGLIEPDSPLALEFGFSSDRWAGYLWRDGDCILLSLVIARQPGRGSLSRLIRAVEARGYRVAIPTPLWRMRAILEHWGWQPREERYLNEPVEVWERPAVAVQGVER
jgi:hypothetical protein